MGPELSKLLSISSAPLSRDPGVLDLSIEIGDRVSASLLLQVTELLRERRGFYAFESALHVMAPSDSEPHVGLRSWNRLDGWRQSYHDMAEGLLFFAEDIFGVQFAIGEKGVVTFDPETGDRAFLADSLEAWAANLLTDFPTLTGHSIAHA